MQILVQILVVLMTSTCWIVSAVANEDDPDFSKDIRPILSNKCFACHGPDENSRVSAFRLDQKASLFAETDSGAIPIVAGDVSQSEIVRRILLDNHERMPPPDSELSLTEAEKELVKRWISKGAQWQEHWAFQIPIKSPVPILDSSEEKRWPKNEIDYFVLSKLIASDKTPNDQANRETLIRRLSFDLTGLPPSIEEVDEFLNDSSEVAYERLVDRLLASPHFGEHFASYWLDAARFADTNGYQNDFKRSMWIWRDWVINTLNENMPYNQFIVEQIAGDLLPNATQDQKIATGFNRNHRTVTEGGSIEEEWHVENIVDRVETTSMAFLGLTIGCARCHDHKFDPISQREFYQFYAFFNNINEKGFHNEVRGNVPPMIAVQTPGYLGRIEQVESEIDTATKNLELLRRKISKTTEKWLKEFETIDKSLANHPGPVFSLLTIVDERADKKNEHPSLDEGRLRDRQDSQQLLLASGNNKIPQFNTITGQSLLFEGESSQKVNLGNVFEFDGEKPFSVSAWIKPASDGAILSKMQGPQSYRGFDMLITPEGRLSVHLIHDWPKNAIKVTTTNYKILFDRWTHVAVSYDGSKTAAGTRIFVNKLRQEVDVEVDALDGTTLTEQPFLLGFREHTPEFEGAMSNVKLFDVCCREADIETMFDDDLRTMLRRSKNLSDASQTDELNELLLVITQTEFAAAVVGLDSLKKKKRSVKKTIPTVMIMEERNEPRPTYLLARGQYDRPIKDVELQPGFPSILKGVSPTKSRLNRLDLAKWISNSNNPLAARVAVNKIWGHLFGIGLHQTTEDFGVQSPLPSNQPLLDWLAVDFMDSGWDVKRLIKSIVCSATYRQSSIVESDEFKQDPKNLNLARASRFRLPAESIRDNALAISGLLVREIGGHSIKPYQPAGLWSDLAGGAGEGPYKMDVDNNLFRRSLYIYRKRTVPHPTMSTFDAPSREVCQVSRQRTNTPLQALALLNDPTYVESARHLAIRAIESQSNQTDRIVHAFRLATSRRPNQKELAILNNSLKNARENFSERPDSIHEYLSTGESQVDSLIDPVELAAFSVVASMILNLDETITRE